MTQPVWRKLVAEAIVSSNSLANRGLRSTHTPRSQFPSVTVAWRELPQALAKRGGGASSPPPAPESRLLGDIHRSGQQVPRPGRGRRGLHQARRGVVGVARGRGQLAVAKDRPDLK